MSDPAFFLDLETRVWQALVAGDAAADRALLAPDFLGVFPSGFSGRDAHVAHLANGPLVAEYRLSEARIVPLGPDRTLLAYRADYTRAGGTAAESMYVSSIWENRDGTWLNIFSQDSSTDAPAPV